MKKLLPSLGSESWSLLVSKYLFHIWSFFVIFWNLNLASQTNMSKPGVKMECGIGNLTSVDSSFDTVAYSFWDLDWNTCVSLLFLLCKMGLNNAYLIRWSSGFNKIESLGSVSGMR